MRPNDLTPIRRASLTEYDCVEAMPAGRGNKEAIEFKEMSNLGYVLDTRVFPSLFLI